MYYNNNLQDSQMLQSDPFVHGSLETPINSWFEINKKTVQGPVQDIVIILVFLKSLKKN